jgi:hypothetical protein
VLAGQAEKALPVIGLSRTLFLVLMKLDDKDMILMWRGAVAPKWLSIECFVYDCVGANSNSILHNPVKLQ